MPPDIKGWNVEDDKFWESTGKRVAYRNLWISVPSLLCGFAIWLMWGIISVQMLNLGFTFSKDELFTLTAISGLAGATMRIPSSFFIRLAGGRNTIFLTTAMLLSPAIGTGIALQHPEWPLWVFQVLALWSGVGGGNFASSMSNSSLSSLATSTFTMCSAKPGTACISRLQLTTVGAIFDRTQAGLVLGWTSTIAAYGSYIAPQVINGQVKAGTPKMAIHGFAVIYAWSLILNWWLYLRPSAEIKSL